MQTPGVVAEFVSGFGTLKVVSSCNLYICPGEMRINGGERKRAILCNRPRSASVRLTLALRGVFTYHFTWAVIVCWSFAQL